MQRKAQRRFDAYAKCVCDHIAAHHNTVHEPYPCRLCECEGFMRAKDLADLNMTVFGEVPDELQRKIRGSKQSESA